MPKCNCDCGCPCGDQAEQMNAEQLYKKYLLNKLNVKTSDEDAKKREQNVKFYKQVYLNAIFGLHFLNEKYDPFNLHLRDWPSKLANDLDDYTEVLGELYDKYKNCKPIKLEPEQKLYLMTVQSALTTHLTNYLFKKPVPDDFFEKIFRKDLPNGSATLEKPLGQNIATLKRSLDTLAENLATRKQGCEPLGDDFPNPKESIVEGADVPIYSIENMTAPKDLKLKLNDNSWLDRRYTFRPFCNEKAVLNCVSPVRNGNVRSYMRY